ncbi:MAG: hypothetical protein ACKVRN_11875 [Pyrinomonadaceae bacterium]
MAAEMSRKQIDRLGDSLKVGLVTDEDLQALNEYRHSFSEAYEVVVTIISQRMNLLPIGRPRKSRQSIADKLRRQTTKLSQMQDIAGCRLVVPDSFVQEIVIDSFEAAFRDDCFEGLRMVDRRSKPSHDYRAVHLIVKTRGRPVEVQLRTALQHRWAELSEKLSDLVDPKIKYGGGDKSIRDLLSKSSMLISQLEEMEFNFLNSMYNFPTYESRPGVDLQRGVDDEQEINNTKKAIFDIMDELVILTERN